MTELAAALTLKRIPRSARGAILNMFERNSASPEEVLNALQDRVGFGDERDLVRYVRDTYGDDEARRMRQEATDEVNSAVEGGLSKLDRRLSSGTIASKVDHLTDQAKPRAILLSIPDPLFTEAITAAYEHQIAAYGEYLNSPPDPHPYVNERFEQVGAPYRMEDGRMVWVGDEGLNEHAIDPALRVLSDPRLADAAREFDHAVTNLRIGTIKGRQDSVNDATRAVEATMVTLLETHGARLPPESRRTVEPLWNAFADAGIAEKALKDVVIGGARLSNKKTRHGPAREATRAEAEAAVTAVANAINYLASLFPPP